MIEHDFNQEKLDWVPSSERVRTTSKRTEPGVVHTYPGSCIGKVVATLGSESPEIILFVYYCIYIVSWYIQSSI
jgi:hypothetical protein